MATADVLNDGDFEIKMPIEEPVSIIVFPIEFFVV